MRSIFDKVALDTRLVEQLVNVPPLKVDGQSAGGEGVEIVRVGNQHVLRTVFVQDHLGPVLATGLGSDPRSGRGQGEKESEARQQQEVSLHFAHVDGCT